MPSLVVSMGRWLLCLLILVVALWIYAPGIQGPALLDDYSSLGALGNLKDSPEQAMDYILGDSSGMLGRPVSMLTFVMEELLGDGSVATGKTINVVLHLLNGVLVAWFFLLLSSLTPVRGYRFAAGLCAAIWLLSPLQVSTVLYVVQRMAMLATFFTLLSLISYLYWRRTLNQGRRGIAYLFFALLAGVLAVFSKENGLVVIPLILMTEALWLQFENTEGGVDQRLRKLTLGLILAGTALAILLLFLYWQWLANAYRIREFSLEERLLTQSRILWDYIRQFFFTDRARLGIYHDDVSVSTSLYYPRTTLWAITTWGALVVSVLALWRYSVVRKLAYGLVFFAAAHSLESTVWPLELYFEHRNYTPSVGLALLPLAAYLVLVKKWPEIGPPLIAWIVACLVMLSFVTSSQVQIWSNSNLLALQHVNGHPESARANRELASRLAMVGARAGALKYSEIAYESALKHAAANDEHYGDYILRNLALACIAGAPLIQAEYTMLGVPGPDRPLGQVSTMSTVIKLRQGDVCRQFDWDGFLDHLSKLYLQDFNTALASAQMFSALAMLANAEQRWDDAYQYTRRYLAMSPESVRGMLMQLHFSTALNKSEEADMFIARLQKLKDAGKLNRGEQDTLALYLEN